MKKLLGSIVMSLLLSGNAYANNIDYIKHYSNNEAGIDQSLIAETKGGQIPVVVLRANSNLIILKRNAGEREKRQSHQPWEFGDRYSK